MRAGRLLGDEQRCGDLAVREVPGQQAEHLTLTPREGSAAPRGAAFARVARRRSAWRAARSTSSSRGACRDPCVIPRRAEGARGPPPERLFRRTRGGLPWPDNARRPRRTAIGSGLVVTAFTAAVQCSTSPRPSALGDLRDRQATPGTAVLARPVIGRQPGNGCVQCHRDAARRRRSHALLILPASAAGLDRDVRGASNRQSEHPRGLARPAVAPDRSHLGVDHRLDLGSSPGREGELGPGPDTDHAVLALDVIGGEPVEGGHVVLGGGDIAASDREARAPSGRCWRGTR